MTVVEPVETLPFLDVFADKTGGSPKVQTAEYLASGLFPIIDQGRRQVAGYSNEESLLAADHGPVIIFGDHTRILKYVEGPFILGADGTKVLVPKIDADARYLFHYLRFVDIPSAGYSRHFKFLKEVRIPLPPVPEQRRIAAILDKADHLRIQRHEALAHLDALTQSIFHSMFGDPVSNDSDFETVPLPEIGHLYSGGTPSKANPDLWDGDVPWFSPKDIKSSHLKDSIDHIAETAISNTSLRLLPADTIVLSSAG